LYINNEYSVKLNTQYDETLNQLSILLNIIIPNNLIPEDPDKVQQTMMDPINLFHDLYEAQNEIFKKYYSKNTPRLNMSR
jgi:hypothetical protein